MKKIFSGEAEILGFKRGFAGLMKGWIPNLVGYSCQGFLRFGLYEFYKFKLQENFPTFCHDNQTLTYLASAGAAEFCAEYTFLS